MENKYNLAEQLAEAEKEYGLNQNSNSSDWFNIEVGSNKVRILTHFEILPYHFVNGKYEYCFGKEVCEHCKNGVPITTQWLCYLIDKREDESGEIKIAKLPYTVVKKVQQLQDDPEWSFDSTPMPYDITIKKVMKKDKNGRERPEYDVVGSPKREEIESEKLEELKEKNSVGEIKENIKNKKAKEQGIDLEKKPEPENENEEINPEDVPF